ncbi:hypothetical protein Pla52n_25650 [Stieleria varia]|uniref:Uncharacterized protein n=1 Tax=Stieleria varia TaxID=2528005 RepID=A0A5C6B2A3_9BACT|nr:hypothetical protein Pla52n_25650 [Stieleria varia]
MNSGNFPGGILSPSFTQDGEDESWQTDSGQSDVLSLCRSEPSVPCVYQIL